MASIRILHPTAMHSVTDDTIVQMNELLDELNPSLARITRETLHNSIADETSLLAIAEDEDDGCILGMAMLTRSYRVNGERVGTLETVVVRRDHQRRGIAKGLVTKLLAIARQSGVSRVSLTSNDARIAAHRLYECLGFTQPKTNLFELVLRDRNRT